ncbi:TetR/AcrR family transcriptional regulator [Lacticaseibacillus thailandensis]|uniref:TetR/AcrR family transcriptional regulator n=1 Tax=Lacticaseibacillus thailandensis TaxID=381741 RepID=UPI0006D0E94C|nr:TetR/AcrR family transcriptional regulator [Lacticaseibacillus thailandensis]
MANHNRNWERTHQRIAQAVFSLWSQKPINKITVNEVCQLVGINRSTFYEHYDSIYTVVDETGDSAYNLLLTFFYPETGKFYLASSLEDAAMHFLAMIKADEAFYRVYFAHLNTLPFGHDEPCMNVCTRRSSSRTISATQNYPSWNWTTCSPPLKRPSP